MLYESDLNVSPVDILMCHLMKHIWAVKSYLHVIKYMATFVS